MTLQLTAEQRVEALRRMTPEMREEFDRLLEGVDPRDVDGFGLWLPEVSPTWSWNWRHLLEVRKALMEVTRGTSRRLMIYQPPRHGKSEMTTIRYPVWRLEKWRDTKVCVGCYNQRFAERFGRKSRQLAEKRGVVSRNRRAAMEWETEKGGVYRSCGVGSPPTGEGFNLIIIDDPVKSREEAESESYRERAWEWYQDLYTRLEPNAAIILMMTRWHEDDLAGRLLEDRLGGDEWKVVSMPALDDDGKALWPERFPRDVLEQYRRVLGEYAFEALYQQRPTAREGNLFKVDRIIEEKAPDDYPTKVRAWDLAATPGGGDYTAGVLLGRNAAGDRWCILDLVRGRWSADERNAIIRTTAVMDGMDTRVRFAQDPGQAGKEQAQGLVGMLGGYVAGSKNVTGNKVTRADPLAAQVNAGNVSMARGDWNRELREELRRFPNGKNDDICLVAGTLIETMRGSVPVETVVAGDLVLTRKGYRRVLRAGQTHNNAEVCRLTTSDGRTLTGTPRHPVWIDGKGFVGMEATTDADILSVCESIHPIQRLTWWCGAALSSVAIRTRRTRAIRDITLQVREILRKASGLSTAKSGRRVTDLSLKDALSTIGTGTRSTTTYPIWSASREAIMPVCIGPQEIEAILNSRLHTSPGSGRLHPSGTSREKAASGTSGMACEPSGRGQIDPSFADPADSLSRAVLTEVGVPTIYDSALGGAPHGNAEQRDGSGWRRSARSAQRRSWGSRGFGPAPVSVARVCVLTQRVPVYNLAVDGEQEYFANGILTHNCDAVSDAFSELAMSEPWRFF